MSLQNHEADRILARTGSHGHYAAADNNYENTEANNSRRAQNEGISGDHLKSITFGGIDGILTSVAITAGAAGAGFGWNVVVGLGFSCVIANALHLGIGEYLSSKAHRDFINTEKRREQWEFKNFKEGEIKEMTDIFEERGMSRVDAESVVRKMAEYDNFFINMMITEELGLQIPEDDDALLIKDSLVMFLSFAILGCLPFITYCLGPTDILKQQDMFNISLLIAAVVLFSLGAIKSTFSSVFWLFSGLETLVLGGVCSLVAYGVGNASRSIFDY
eukprot:gene11485-24014_t